MKKTFLAMLLAGGTMTMFAQTNPTSPTNPASPTSPNTTQQAAGVTNNIGTYDNTQMNNENRMNGMDTTTPGHNINMRNGMRTNSTSWAPEKDPAWGWNNYGVWNSDANWNANGNAMNNTTGINNTGSMTNQNMNNNMNAGNTNWNNQQNNAGWNQNNMNADGSMSSSGAYSAYGTTVPYLPSNVQTRFGQDYPMNADRSYAWHQYGDWYHTHHMDNGRSTQYFYDAKGNGYSLALPVLMSYVPENIVNSALNKYGSDLYSISMVKTNDGKDNYMIGLLDRGQISMHYLDESGASVNDVWRTEDYGTMESTQSNAAMSDDRMNSNMNQNSSSWDANKDKKSWDADKDKKNWDADKYKSKKHHDKKGYNKMR